MTSRDRIWWMIMIVGVLLALTLFVRITAGDSATPRATYQGKNVIWWAKKAQQARRDANARRATVIRLRKTLNHDPSVEESIKLATIIYSGFSEARAWRIIKHESWMTRDPLHAYNATSVNGCHATGLYQFLDCTFRSTPFAGMSIYSPYAQSLAAGWMHQHGRGCEWDIDC